MFLTVLMKKLIMNIYNKRNSLLKLISLELGGMEVIKHSRQINEFADIYMTTTSGQTWYLDKITGTPIKWAIPKTDNFNYVRYFEDTDSVFIVWKNDSWVFIIDRTKSNISKEEQRLIKYFKDVHGRVLNGDNIYFFMEQKSGCIDLVDIKWKEITHTDLSNSDKIKSSKIIDKKILEVMLETGEKRKYLI